MALNINFYQIQNVTIESTSENFKKIIDNIISIGIPQLSCSVGEIDLSIITYKYPDKLNLSGSISINMYENNDFSIYEKLKTIIDSGEEFDLTITVTIIGISESSNTFNASTITYTLKNCKILTLPQGSYTNVDEPSNITYDVELYYGRFEISIS